MQWTQIPDTKYHTPIAFSLSEPARGASLAMPGIIGNSAGLKSVLKEVNRVADADSTVLIQGETGTGKELIARALHEQSRRRGRPFQRINCAAIPRDLLESDLFGHEKGAFTGAIASKIGRFESAGQGTIFLDEIGEMPLDLQPKLLRVLQEREFERLGSSRTIGMHARVIAATNRSLASMVDERAFREDLFYRLNVFPISLPPLRERREDIPLLVNQFLQHFAHRMGKNIATASPQVIQALMRYNWPGNIRELQNVIERAVVLSEEGSLVIDESQLKRGSPQPSYAAGPFATTIADREREMIEAALAESQGRISGPSGAAAKLGIPRQTLDSKISNLQISKSRFKTQITMEVAG